MITFSTHCSGGELAGVGFRQAGAQHVDGFEINPKIAAVARLNGFNVHAMDVCAVDYAALVPVDHQHTSPSCKRASRANTNQGETDDDLAVADSVVRLIQAHRGRTFSLENVIEYRWFESFDRICQALKECGFLFRVVAKGGEKPSWRASTPLWHDAGEFVDAADFGVPQNRKRLIVRAVRGVDRLPGLRPTHSRRGGVLLERWNGWYGAIADLIADLPDTTPAPWQLARMPAALRESMLIGQGGYEGRIGMFGANEPAPTMTANRNHQQLRAYLCGGGNTGWETVSSHARADHLPAFTVRDGRNGSPERAFVIGGQYATNNTHTERTAQTADQDNPIFTITTRAGKDTRAYAGGVWKRLTIKSLGRFQSVPDDYLGLTPEINGNGVSCLLARRIMESLRGVYES